MAIAYILGWWYGRGWRAIPRSVLNNLQEVQDTFSTGILLKTWFSPWKQIQTPSSFRNFFQSALDNLISRLVGAIVRTGMLLAAFLLNLTILICGLFIVVIWPFFPLLIILLPVAALTV